MIIIALRSEHLDVFGGRSEGSERPLFYGRSPIVKLTVFTPVDGTFDVSWAKSENVAVSPDEIVLV